MKRRLKHTKNIEDKMFKTNHRNNQEDCKWTIKIKKVKIVRFNKTNKKRLKYMPRENTLYM